MAGRETWILRLVFVAARRRIFGRRQIAPKAAISAASATTATGTSPALAITSASAIETTTTTTTTVAISATATAAMFKARAVMLLRARLRSRNNGRWDVIGRRLRFERICRITRDAFAFHRSHSRFAAAVLRRCAAEGRRMRGLRRLIVRRDVVEPFNFFQEVADVQEGVAIQADFDEGRLHAGKHARDLALV